MDETANGAPPGLVTSEEKGAPRSQHNLTNLLTLKAVSLCHHAPRPNEEFSDSGSHDSLRARRMSGDSGQLEPSPVLFGLAVSVAAGETSWVAVGH